MRCLISIKGRDGGCQGADADWVSRTCGQPGVRRGALHAAMLDSGRLIDDNGWHFEDS
jgi:hypothetical protein